MHIAYIVDATVTIVLVYKKQNKRNISFYRLNRWALHTSILSYLYIGVLANSCCLSLSDVALRAGLEGTGKDIDPDWHQSPLSPLGRSADLLSDSTLSLSHLDITLHDPLLLQDMPRTRQLNREKSIPSSHHSPSLRTPSLSYPLCSCSVYECMGVRERLCGLASVAVADSVVHDSLANRLVVYK